MSHTTIDSQQLELAFDAELATVEGILALVQEWASERGVSYDDRLSLRLVLEELLSNICLHSSPSPEHTKITLLLKYITELAQKEIHITLQDNGKAFNPLRQSDLSVESIHDTPLGNRGLSLVRLFTLNAVYTRKNGNNLSFTLSLDTEKEKKAITEPLEAAQPKRSWIKYFHALWKGKMAFRQTVLITFYSFILLWGGIAVFYLTTQSTLKTNALELGMQTMHTQSVISSTFLNRIQGNVHRLDTALSAIPASTLFANEARKLTEYLQQMPISSSLAAEIPLIGIIAGREGRTWMYPVIKGSIFLPKNMEDLSKYVDVKNPAIPWKTLPMTFNKEDPHAAMIYAIPLSTQTSKQNEEQGKKQGTLSPEEIQQGWVGVIITMPWIANTLSKLTSFTHAAPIYLDHTGQYVIYPPQRRLGEGAQSLRDEADLHNISALRRIEENILAGKKGIQRLSTKHPWQLPWTGDTSLIYYPMDTPGWYLALLVESAELGDDNSQALPLSFIFVALLGPLVIGCITWIVTYKTLRPLHSLTESITKLSEGDTETPFPKALFPDEMGNMLTTFERVRVTLRMSFRNLVDNATRQQKLSNELALARNTQESMLPRSLPQREGTQVAASIDMASEVCGDLYTCFAHPNKPSHLFFVIGDVCDKGIPAALIMSRSVSLARSFLMEENSSPSQVLESLNASLLRNDTSAMFVSMLVATLDTETGILQWASAGHPPPIIATPHEEHGTILPWSQELVLNVRLQQRYTTFTLALTPQQSVLLYTDGADEAMGPPNSQQGQLFGDERLTQSFARACHSHQHAESILQEVRQDLRSHMQDLQPADDISLMVIRWEGASQTS